MEYPVGTGYIAATIARFSDTYLHFFDLNALALLAIFIATTLLLYRMAPKFWYFFSLAPAVVSSLYINWDLWAVLAMVVSFYYLKVEKFDLAGFFLGLSIAIKFFPIFFIPALILFFRNRKQLKSKEQVKVNGGVEFFSYLTLTLVALNLTTAIKYFEGWSRFFTFNQERGIDLGSLWYSLSLLGMNLPKGLSLNLVIAAILLLLILSNFRSLLSLLSRRDSELALRDLAVLSFLSLALLFSLNKVYSPQYVLWLLPLAVIAIHEVMSQESEESSLRFHFGRICAWFWIWQIGEAIYHLAIWQYLVGFSSGASSADSTGDSTADSSGYGLPATFYALTILIRILTLAVFSLQLYRARLSLPSQASS
jgi:uncharacterized membrane protein